MDLTRVDIIREAYKNTLILPSKRNSRQFFLCPVGLVGAGKSTVIKPLSEKLSLVRISSDEIRQILKKQNMGYQQLMEIAAPLAEELATQGFSLALDADCGNLKTKEFIINLAQKVRAEVFWIHINPPEDFILHKLRTYNHTWLFKDGEEAVKNYFEQKKKRQEENTHFNFLTTIDTSRSDLVIQIEQTVNLIKEKTSL